MIASSGGLLQEESSWGCTELAALHAIVPDVFEKMYEHVYLFAAEREAFVASRMPCDESLRVDVLTCLAYVELSLAHVSTYMQRVASEVTSIHRFTKYVRGIFSYWDVHRAFFAPAGPAVLWAHDDTDAKEVADRHDVFRMYDCEPGLSELGVGEGTEAAVTALNRIEGLGMFANVLNPSQAPAVCLLPRGLQLQFLGAMWCLFAGLSDHAKHTTLLVYLKKMADSIDDDMWAELSAAHSALPPDADRNGVRLVALLQNACTALLIVVRCMFEAQAEAPDAAVHKVVWKAIEGEAARWEGCVKDFDALMALKRPTASLLPHLVGASSTVVKRASNIEACKFLSDQIKRHDSAYVVPSEKAPERDWLAWERKGGALPKSFDIDEATIIQYTTAHLHEASRILFGWAEKAAERKGVVTIADFMAHVRSALFASPHARRDAMRQLLELHPLTRQFADCHALVTYIKELMSRLYPAADRRADELEPMTPLAAMQVLHEFLRRVKDMPYRQRPTDFQRAWAASEGCNLELLYRDYLRAQDSTKVWQWFEVVCKELLAAREYFSRSRAGGAVSVMTTGAMADPVAAAARQLHIPKQQIYALQKGRNAP